MREMQMQVKFGQEKKKDKNEGRKKEEPSEEKLKKVERLKNLKFSGNWFLSPNLIFLNRNKLYKLYAV